MEIIKRLTLAIILSGFAMFFASCTSTTRHYTGQHNLNQEYSRNRVVGEFYAQSHGASTATGNDAAGQEAYRDSSLQRNQNK